MTNGTGPRRRRRTEPAFDSYEGDWLSGLRQPTEGQEDEFDAPATGASTWTYPPASDLGGGREPSGYEPTWRKPSQGSTSRHGSAMREPSARDTSWLDPLSSEPAPGPMPDEEPIFRPWDATAPSEPPPILQEQPMLRYMQESRVAPSPSSYAPSPSSYGRRRRTPEPSGPDYRPPPQPPRRRYFEDEPPARVTPAPRDPYPPREEYLPPREEYLPPREEYLPPREEYLPPREEEYRSEPDHRFGQYAGPAPGSVRPRRPDDSGGMRAVRPETSGQLPRVGPSVPPEPAAPAGNGRTTSGGMRTVRPDTGGQARITTGGQPRVSPVSPAGETGSRSGAMRAVRPETPSLDARPPRRTMLTTVGVVLVLAVFGAAAFFLFGGKDGGSQKAQNAGAQASAKPPPRDISNREVDPAPLTEAEVFPGQQVAGQPPYAVMKTQISEDCGVAAVDDLARMLADNGCTEVVRATLKSGDGAYLVTAGIFNLADTQRALASHENIKPTIDAQKGRFTGLLAGQGTEALVRAPMILGWHARGHFLAYCVIARADGNGFDAGDTRPNLIQNDILTAYLRDTVIGGRTLKGTAGSSPSPQQSG